MSATQQRKSIRQAIQCLVCIIVRTRPARALITCPTGSAPGSLLAQGLERQPPGTGKMYIAKTLARHLAGLDNVTIVQFHPAYSYEDFFEGFRPSPHSDGQVGFELKPGPMRRLTDRAGKHPDQLFVLVVDEIKRGSLAKIFGELHFLLEYRDEAIDLMYSSDDAEPFTLPRNVVIIGRVAHGGPLDRPRGHCYAPALRIRCTRRRSRRNLLLRRWLTARKYPQHGADLHRALNAAIDDPDAPVRALEFHAPGSPQ